MAEPVIPPELLQWIRTQGAAGLEPAQLAASMVASGWEAATAATMLQLVLGRPVPGPVPDAARNGSGVSMSPVPAPKLEQAPYRLQVEGHPVTVLSSMKHPRVFVFGGLLSDEECDALVESAAPRMKRSETVDNATGATQVHVARTSSGMFFRRGETALVDRIERRIAALLEWPLENGEGLQILHYTPGAEYQPHYDYFDPAHPGSAPILKRGGQRVATLVMYLNTPVKGGATVFPDVGLDVAPVKGNAVFFTYDRPHPATRSLHGGAPVVEGEKWVATKWLREREFV